MSPELRAILARGRMHWPGARFFREQKMMIESVALNHETFVTAGNKLGKDYTAGFVCVLFFTEPWLFFPVKYFEQIERERVEMEARTGKPMPAWRAHTRRIVTTSVDGDHLRNLWGEIGRWISSSEIPLNCNKGGPLVVNQRDVTLAEERADSGDPLNYLIGRVTATGEGLSGAHAAYNLMVIDEASGSDDMVYHFAQPWAKRFLCFGNPNKCSNFWYRAVKAGDLA